MAERAARFVDLVFPHVSVRQWVLSLPHGWWVLSLPHRLRCALASGHARCRAIVGVQAAVRWSALLRLDARRW